MIARHFEVVYRIVDKKGVTYLGGFRTFTVTAKLLETNSRSTLIREHLAKQFNVTEKYVRIVRIQEIA